MTLLLWCKNARSWSVRRFAVERAQDSSLYQWRRFGAIALLSFGMVACSQSSVEPIIKPQKNIANLAINHIQRIDRTQLTNFPHKPLELKDAVPPGSEFDQFRKQLREAIATRDMRFIEPLIPSYGVRIGVGLPFTLEELRVEATNEKLWRTLEKTLEINSCQQDTQTRYSSADANSPIWVCPNVASEFYRQYPPPSSGDRLPHALAHVIAIGTDVKLYSEPNADSTVVALLTNEVVKFDYQTWSRFTDDEKVLYLDSLDGWTPVSLADGRSGFLPNHAANRPLDPRVVFGKIGQQWKILDIPRGD